MLTFHINFTELAILFSVFLRLSLALFLVPIFNSTNAPTTFKACATMALTALVFPIVRDSVIPLPLDLLPLAIVVTGEIIFGLLVSMAVQLLFSTFRTAGEIISFEMGFGFAQTADPMGGPQSMLFSIWFQLLVSLLFFSLNGHHFIIKAIVESFRTIPIGAFALNVTVFNKMIALTGRLFIIAVKIAAPVMVVLLLVQLGMGLMSKFAPQVNILVTSFPITICLGILFMSFSVVAWGEAMRQYLHELIRFIGHL